MERNNRINAHRVTARQRAAHRIPGGLIHRGIQRHRRHNRRGLHRQSHIERGGHTPVHIRHRPIENIAALRVITRDAQQRQGWRGGAHLVLQTVDELVIGACIVDIKHRGCAVDDVPHHPLPPRGPAHYALACPVRVEARRHTAGHQVKIIQRKIRIQRIHRPCQRVNVQIMERNNRINAHRVTARQRAAHRIPGGLIHRGIQRHRRHNRQRIPRDHPIVVIRGLGAVVVGNVVGRAAGVFAGDAVVEPGKVRRAGSALV